MSERILWEVLNLETMKIKPTGVKYIVLGQKDLWQGNLQVTKTLDRKIWRQTQRLERLPKKTERYIKREMSLRSFRTFP